jgi:hypothetical protein
MVDLVCLSVMLLAVASLLKKERANAPTLPSEAEKRFMSVPLFLPDNLGPVW